MYLFLPNEEAERGLRGIQFEARYRIGTLVRDIDEIDRENIRTLQSGYD